LKTFTLRLASAGLALALVGVACGSDDEPTTTPGQGSTATTPKSASSPSATSGAATLRAGLTGLLTEHVYLAALATGSALRGDTKGFEAYATALNGPSNSNTYDLTAAMTSVYGADVGKAFDGLWRSEGHIPGFVAYTQAIAANDTGKADKAVADALAYAKTFGTTMNSVNSLLPAAAVEDAIKMHVTTLKAVIDAQKSGDATATATTLRAAVAHMSDTATVLSDATVKKFAEKF
jgi:hypothetical protein